MDRMLVSVFDDRGKAHEAADALEVLHAEGSISLYSIAIVTRSRQGDVSLTEIPGHELHAGILGVPAASFAALLGAPASVAAKASSGTLAELLIDLLHVGVSPHFLDEISKQMVPGKAAIVAEVDEGRVTILDACLERFGGDVFRRTRSAVDDTLLERDIAAFRADVASLKAESAISGAHDKRIRARIDALEAELQAIEMQAVSRVCELKREAEAKIKWVQGQAAAAHGEVRAGLERRIAEIRADYEARSVRLNLAERLARAALSV